MNYICLHAQDSKYFWLYQENTSLILAQVILDYCADMGGYCPSLEHEVECVVLGYSFTQRMGLYEPWAHFPWVSSSRWLQVQHTVKTEMLYWQTHVCKRNTCLFFALIYVGNTQWTCSYLKWHKICSMTMLCSVLSFINMVKLLWKWKMNINNIPL